MELYALGRPLCRIISNRICRLCHRVCQSGRREGRWTRSRRWPCRLPSRFVLTSRVRLDFWQRLRNKDVVLRLPTFRHGGRAQPFAPRRSVRDFHFPPRSPVRTVHVTGEKPVQTYLQLTGVTLRSTKRRTAIRARLKRAKTLVFKSMTESLSPRIQFMRRRIMGWRGSRPGKEPEVGDRLCRRCWNGILDAYTKSWILLYWRVSVAIPRES